MAETEDSDRYRAPALDKGLDILELLAHTDGGLTQAEIAKLLGKSPNEFYRMLDRLVRRGYVARQGGDRFILTLKMFGLAHFHAPVRRLVSFATPVMRDFANTAQQSCHLAVHDRGEVVVIAQQDSPTYWGISIRVGARISLFNTGSGHVLLAFRDASQREMMCAEQERLDPETVRPDDLESRLEAIKDRGFEIMDSLQTAGVRNISAPVLSLDGHALAALTCPFITPLLPGAPRFEDIERVITAAAREISDMVGGSLEASR